MITGIVTAAREAVIVLNVRGPSGQEVEIHAVIDTGFDGSLTLPAQVITSLRLPWRRRGRSLLADGNETLFDIYEATVIWHGSPRRVAVDLVDLVPLVGMSLLYASELTIRVVERGSVLITPLT
ncbi:MAG: clan AA aspartic protease [Deltaproteobacteria bacterium]|nr:clan AA aspartic protease [Deltaproteobacteria bacterium]